MSHASTNCDWKMSITKGQLSNCDCKISQLVRELFAILIKGGNEECDCKSHPGMGKKRRGGAGARKRRSVRRAESSLPPLPPTPHSHSPEPPVWPPLRSSTSLATPWPRPLPRPPASPTPRPPQRSSSLKSSKNAMDRKKDLDRKSALIKNVTTFLDQNSEEQNRIAKKKIEIYQKKSTPGEGYEKKEVVPAHMVFCFICKYYKAKIHYCSALGKYVNLDDRNLFFVEGDTQNSVEGFEELRVGKSQTWMFGTRSKMKEGLRDLVVRRKRGRHIPVFSLASDPWK